MSFESYPPPFRNLVQQPQRPPAQNVDSTCGALGTDPIPVVDLGLLELGDCKLLEEPCKQWGLFRLVNHGAPQSLLSKLQEKARGVFSLSLESKRARITSPLEYFWGTPALSQELSVERLLNINLVEGLKFPLSQLHLFQTDNPIIASFCVVMVKNPKTMGTLKEYANRRFSDQLQRLRSLKPAWTCYVKLGEAIGGGDEEDRGVSDYDDKEEQNKYNSFINVEIMFKGYWLELEFKGVEELKP